VGESSFWYRPTRVVPDQRPLNGRCCCCKQNSIGIRCTVFVVQSMDQCLIDSLFLFMNLLTREWSFMIRHAT